MNRATKRERLRRIKRASMTVALFSSPRAGIFSMRYAQSCIKLGRRKILEAWRMGHGRLPSSLANYLYKKARRKDRARNGGTSFGRLTYHRHDAW